MQFAPTQIASSPRVAGRSTRRRSENASRQLALFGDGTPTLPLTSAAQPELPDTARAAVPATAPTVPQALRPQLRVLPVVRPSAVAIVAPLPPTASASQPEGGRVLTAEDEVWQPMTGVQKLLEVGGASLLMMACVALAIFW